jgi:hypothetical protein
MAEDFIYTVNQVAIILNKSDKTVRTYIAEGALGSTKKIEERSGIEKVFISATSLANLIEKKALRVNFDALEKYTPSMHVLENLFGRGQHSLEEAKKEVDSLSPSNDRSTLPTPSNASDESLVIAILKEQVSKLEAEKDELKQDLREKDRQIEEKNLALIATTRENGDKYQLIALAKEQIEARLVKLIERTRILHLSTNRDIRRLQEGKLQAGDLSLLPLSFEGKAGDYEAETTPEEDRPPSPPLSQEEAHTSVETAPSAPAQTEATEFARAEREILESEPIPSPPAEQATSPKARKATTTKHQKKSSKEKPAPKRGFFRRLFGG